MMACHATDTYPPHAAARPSYRVNKTIQIFRAGTHTAMSGDKVTISKAQLDACAAAYDPAVHEAPIVVGHPAIDGPAYGWAAKVVSRGDALEAVPHQVDPAFAEMVAAGRFKKVSASFWTPGAPTNPSPGVYYVRHIGFLGAAAPAVKGLRQAQFSGNEAGTVTVEFGDWADAAQAGLFRRLRDWFIAEFGLDKADAVLPSYEIAALESDAAQVDAAPMPAAFAAPTQTEGSEMSDVNKARIDELEAENAILKSQARKVAAEAAEKERLARHGRHVAFADGLAAQGKPIGDQRDALVAVLDYAGEGEGTIEFGEGDAHQKIAPAAALITLICALPKWVEFGEIAKAVADDRAAVVFAAPQGYSVDAESADLHARATAYRATHPDTDYLAAVAAVKGA